ncbi:peptidase S16 [Sandarakinorhabdus cyanobacteriorum]|uniref:Peptidase S16 n=1 Tax=Sandarakinorhabdus cyanobacteriorum TaxID=1981098 RepID=A0A255YDX9_9SPHN|nr:LON peptidase substrate-binding domain-containing protein [Sandarakinorhabdus cyanobacteriorum]OYQ26765.1 peptidase S16 [Sandarakinorhabdus cyanobacteriorum]
MSESEAFEPLPAAVPVFPLTGAVLFPRGVLPLNIFEPRYLAMVKDAMAATGAAHRIIGIIQPKGGGKNGAPLALYKVGCLGRITEYRETDDGRILIALVGVSRFRVGAELERDTLYRQVMTDYHGFADDRHEPAALDPATRAGLEEALRPYLDARGLSADWDAVQSADDEALVTTLASVLPFEPAEKQALLETITLAERAQTLATLMSFAASSGPTGLQ